MQNFWEIWILKHNPWTSSIIKAEIRIQRGREHQYYSDRIWFKTNETDGGVFSLEANKETTDLQTNFNCLHSSNAPHEQCKPLWSIFLLFFLNAYWRQLSQMFSFPHIQKEERPAAILIKIVPLVIILKLWPLLWPQSNWIDHVYNRRA